MTQYNQIELTFSDGRKHPFFYRENSVGDKGVMQQVFQNQDYELGHFKMAKPLAKYIKVQLEKKKLLLVDAGANIGASPIYFCTKFGNSKVIAIEPEKQNFELLKRNTEGFNITLMEAAVGCEPGTMFLKDPGLSDWGFRVEETGDYEVNVVTIGQILNDHPETEYVPVLCKVDIEGGEANLFAKNYAWIDKFPLIIIELHDWMLPGEGNSRNFRKALSEFDFDFVFRGENAFCFNNRILKEFR